MASMRRQSILDEQVGNVTSPNANDKIVLLGAPPNDTSPYHDDLVLIVYPGDGSPEMRLSIPDGGYYMQLFIGDFTGNGLSNIMIRGDFGGTGNYVIARIYTYEDGALKEIFNQADWGAENQCTATYLDNYKVKIECPNTPGSFTFDISYRPQDFLDTIYTSDKKVKPYSSASVSYPLSALPIKPLYQPNYDLMVQQRIVGSSNADTLGYIQTDLTYKDGMFIPLQKGLLLVTDTYNPENISRIQNLIRSTQKNSNYYELMSLSLSAHNLPTSIASALDVQLNHLWQQESLLYTKLQINDLVSRNSISKKRLAPSLRLNKLLLNSVKSQYALCEHYRSALLEDHASATTEALTHLLALQLKKCSTFLCLQSHVRSLSNPSRNEIYYNNEFNVSRDNLDLIVNSIREDRNTLYLDAYILNLKNIPLSQIINFNITLRDTNGKVFAQKTFDQLDIGMRLQPYEGKRIFLPFFSNEYSLFETNTANLSWNYTYNFK